MEETNFLPISGSMITMPLKKLAVFIELKDGPMARIVLNLLPAETVLQIKDASINQTIQFTELINMAQSTEPTT